LRMSISLRMSSRRNLASSPETMSYVGKLLTILTPMKG